MKETKKVQSLAKVTAPQKVKDEHETSFDEILAFTDKAVNMALMLLVLIAAWMFLSKLAYNERGYFAIGGEIFLMPIIAWVLMKGAKR